MAVVGKFKVEDIEVKILALLFSMILFISVVSIHSQTTDFTYQGQLRNSSAPSNGNHDFEFLLFDSLSGGNQLGATIVLTNVTVADGVFSVQLNFGSQFPGAIRFLEIHVRQSGGGVFTPLSPRQPVTSAPYSVKSLNADTAANAAQLNGQAGSFYQNASNLSSGTLNNARLGVVPVVNGGTGSATQNFVDLTTPQTIGGDKTFSGTLTGNTINSATHYSIGGTRVLSIAGLENLFTGAGAGANTNGIANSFFGTNAGQNNIGGNSNSFFGGRAGRNNTSGGNNTFLGEGAGLTNTTGSSNTIIGGGANVGANNLTFATSIGAGATVSTNSTVVLGRAADTVQVPGSLNVIGTVTANGTGLTNLNATNITSGTLNNARLGVVPIANGGTGSATQNFVDLGTAQSVGGSKTFGATTRVSNGASGATPLASADLIVEDNGAAFQHFLTPDDVESGILFGDATDSIAGGLIFNNAATDNGIQFRAGGNTTRMTLDGSGNLGIGTAPSTRLDVSGSIQLTGEVRRTSTGNANMVPVAYGHVLEDGTAASGTGNFSISHTQGTGRYDISVTGEDFGVGANGYSVLVTVMNHATATFPTTSTLGGDLVIQMLTINGTAASGREFSFLIFKP